MPRFLYARPAVDAAEEKKIRKLAGARHAPADWIRRARMIVLSRQGLHTTAIAAEPGCHPQTVRERLTRFNAEGPDGLGDQPIPGRPRRLTEDERSQIIALARAAPPGRLVRDAAGDLAPAVSRPPQQRPGGWTLDTLTQVAREAGIDIKRSQVRRILLREGVRWRRTHTWGRSTDPGFAPKGPGSWSSTPARRRTPR
jgi:transposase